MNAALIEVGTIFDAKYGPYKGKATQKFIFKDIDTLNNYSMNLPLDWAEKTKWEKSSEILKEGNIFYGLKTLADKGYPNNIDFRAEFEWVEIKEVNKDEVRDNID